MRFLHAPRTRASRCLRARNSAAIRRGALCDSGSDAACVRGAPGTDPAPSASRRGDCRKAWHIARHGAMRRSSVRLRARKAKPHRGRPVLMQDETPSDSGAETRAPASELARPVAEALAAGLGTHARSLVAGLEPRDLADLIELLEPASASSWSRRWGATSARRCCPSSTRPCATSSAGAAQGGAGQGRRRARDRRRRLPAREHRRAGPAGNPGADAQRRSRRAGAQPRISARHRRPSHADGLRGGAAVLDRRPGHRPHARGRGPAGDLLRHLRRRSDLPCARQRGPEPAAAHQAARTRRHHHGRGPRKPCWPPPTRKRWRASSSATISSPRLWWTPTSAWSASLPSTTWWR